MAWRIAADTGWPEHDSSIPPVKEHSEQELKQIEDYEYTEMIESEAFIEQAERAQEQADYAYIQTL